MLTLNRSVRAKTGLRERSFPIISRFSITIHLKIILEFVRYSYLNCFLKPYQMDFASPFPIFKKKMRQVMKGVTQIIKNPLDKGLTGLVYFAFILPPFFTGYPELVDTSTKN